MNISNWSISYIVNKSKYWIYTFTHKGYPWLTSSANNYLAQWIKPNYSVFEWGSGASTLWFAKKSKSVTSVEHNESWYRKVLMRLERNGIKNVHLHFCDYSNNKRQYAHYINEFSDASLDVIIVDGKQRASCMRMAVPKLKQQGLLILDNADRFFNYTASQVISAKNDSWKDVFGVLQSWETIITDNGVFATIMFIKP